MADLRTIAALVAVSLAVSGCGLDALEGKKSDAQIAVERRAALAMPLTAVDAPAEVVADIEPPAAEPCIPVFRVTTCDGTEAWP